MCAAGPAVERVFRSPGWAPQQSYALDVYWADMTAAVLTQVLLWLLTGENKKINLKYSWRINLYASSVHLPWTGLSVCELTECSAPLRRPPRCRNTFSILISVSVSVRSIPSVCWSRSWARCSRYDSSVCVALSSCKTVPCAITTTDPVSERHQAGRAYRASKEAVRRNGYSWPKTFEAVSVTEAQQSIWK